MFLEWKRVVNHVDGCSIGDEFCKISMVEDNLFQADLLQYFYDCIEGEVRLGAGCRRVEPVLLQAGRPARLACSSCRRRRRGQQGLHSCTVCQPIHESSLNKEIEKFR